MKAIDRFISDYDFFSNMSPYGFERGGVHWPTNEHYFQAMKAVTHKDCEWIRTARNPKEAKRRGRQLRRIRKDWDVVKISHMYKGLELKFDQNKGIRQKLIDTGDAVLIEDNYWNDTYWGVCDGVGQNILGVLLMKLRSELVNEINVA